MKMGIYIITNIESKKYYIGSTTDSRRRWGEHRRQLRRSQHDNSHLQRAWNKYGESAFEFGMLEYLDNPEELYLAEQFWMDIYREEGKKLYNCGLAAHSPMLGRHHTEEVCRKLSELNKGKTLSEETRHKISEARKGITFSEEHRRKIGAGNKGKRYSVETRTKIAIARAKPYPAFCHRVTGEIIPAGINLKALCKERNLNLTRMRMVKIGNQRQYKGWELAKYLDGKET